MAATPASTTTPRDWAELCSRAFVPLDVDTPAATPIRPGFRGTLIHRPLADGVALTAVRSTPSHVIRTDATIARHPADTLLFALHHRGFGDIYQGGRHVGITSGTVTAYATNSPYGLHFTTAIDETILQVPLATLNLPRRILQEATARPLQPSPELTTLRALVGAYSPQQETPDSPTLGTVAALGALATAALTRGSLFEPRTPVGLDHEQLFRAAEQLIRQYLCNSGLTPDFLAGQLHISRRTLDTVFTEHYSSAAASIRAARLGHAHTLLEGGATVTAAAQAIWGGDVSGFSRAFARHFGYRPSEVRNLI